MNSDKLFTEKWIKTLFYLFLLLLIVAFTLTGGWLFTFGSFAAMGQGYRGGLVAAILISFTFIGICLLIARHGAES